MEAKGERLHYAAKVDLAAGVVDVGPLACAAEHPFNNAGPDNMVSLYGSTFSRAVWRLYGGAKGIVMWY